MTKQITVRLDDVLIDFVDSQVSEGHARSRAAVVADALLRERDRRLAERDVEILRRAPDDPELQAWVRAASRPPLDDEG